MSQSLNDYSFVRTYDSGSPVSLPILSLREKQRISPPLIFVPDELLSFYISLPVTGALTLTDGSGNVFDGGATLTNLVTTIGDHTIMDVAVPDIPEGVYQMKIGTTVSNFVEVVHDIDYANQISAFFRIRHNKIIQKYYYPYAGPSYRQRMRLRMTLVDQQPETNIEGYEETNTGKQRNLQGVSKKYVTFQTPDYTLEDHDAAHLLSLHDSILINDREYIRRPSGTYKVQPAMDTPVSTGEFTLYDQNAQFLLRC